MSKDHWEFREESGEVGFLAGVIDALSDKLELTCEWGYALDADIFPVADNEISKLNDVIIERIRHYDLPLSCLSAIDNIDELSIQLERIECDTSQFFYEKMSKFSSAEDLMQHINGFLDDIRWHVGDPICVYTPIHSNDNDDLTVLGRVYLYTPFDYFFIQYEEYIVFIVFGSVE